MLVDLIGKQDVCSSASQRGKYRQKVYVGSKSTLSVPFVIIPMKEGKLQIEVKAVVLDPSVSIHDGIMKHLLVVVRQTDSCVCFGYLVVAQTLKFEEYSVVKLLLENNSVCIHGCNCCFSQPKGILTKSLKSVTLHLAKKGNGEFNI